MERSRAMGFVGLTRCLRPSPELRLSYCTLVWVGLGFVALGFLAGSRTSGPAPVVEPAVPLLVLAWRAAVLTRRGAW